MPSIDQFPKKPPIRFKLTKAQARKIEAAKEAGESVIVCGYSRRHPWPDPDAFTLCAWFVDCESLTEALKASAIMATRRRPGRKKAKPVSNAKVLWHTSLRSRGLIPPKIGGEHLAERPC